jgi:regulator of protease activity HflC (stomatin/prohibitin superfamily)
MTVIYDAMLIFLIFLGLMAVVVILSPRRMVIFEYERGVMFHNGKFQHILTPGVYWLLQHFDVVQKVDIRTKFITIPGQEVLSADNINVKVSIAASFRLDDPLKALTTTSNYSESLYLILQLGLRDLFATSPIEELLTKRSELSKRLFETSVDKVSDIGLTLLSADIKDFMFPGDLKNIFAQVVNARNEGLAALERARGESAALRSLANAAKMLENNPALLQLRTLQAIESKGGNTVVLSAPQEITGILPTLKKK